MSIESYDLITVESDRVTVDLIVWRRYRSRALGILEATLDANPHLAKVHKTSPFLPVGTQVRIPIDPAVLRGRPQPRATVVLYGRTDDG